MASCVLCGIIGNADPDDVDLVMEAGLPPGWRAMHDEDCEYYQEPSALMER